MRLFPRVAGTPLLLLCLLAAPQAWAEQGATTGGGDGTEAFVEPTFIDATPTLTDNSPTVEFGSAVEGAVGHMPSGENVDTGDTQHVATDAASAAGLHCAVDITSQLTGDGATTESAPKTATYQDHTVTLGSDVSDLECVEMADAVPTRIGADGIPVPVTSVGAVSATETLLLTRLQERRSELDSQESVLSMQEDLLQAAEARLQERAALLETSKDELAASVDAAAARSGVEIASLAALFETMKPKDAAAIMAGLPDETLVSLAKLVSTRKLAPIMAELPPQRAGALTVLLAQAE
jgi:flagellar motility protein MotE (MotC chaperone)